ncbi:formate/nitrite transporter [Williamsoniiplasma luminosum]|uniref:Formate/nitrite transporter n=2 Tax=Williamsoniiplasma luminosum TaxID=214888 RepID=A0A2K8NU88_9MOLU|nr:formate/nitrite transporter family protein [Williamsoniiplasma luminosum]ATZ17106.1 formate/nitrite transporter [Williamsoniiplasma luminosum]
MEQNKFLKMKKLTRSMTNDEIQEEIHTLEKVDYTPLYNKDVAYHNYGYIHTFRVISDGLRLSSIKQFFGGLLAGIWIGVAYTAILYATYKMENASVVKLLTGLLFSGVILLIAFLGGGFVTAHMWYNRTMFRRVEKWSIFLKACGLVYLGNIAGIGIFLGILFLSGAFNGNDKLLIYAYESFGLGKLYSVGTAIKTGQTFTNGDVWQTISWVFFSGILCNFLICLATQGAKSTKGNTVATMIMYIVVLFFFAIGGYQHCVANWYGAWVLIILAIDPNVAGNIQTSPGHDYLFNVNSAWLYLSLNIIPAVLGNFVGALIIGTFMGLFNMDYDKLLLKEARLRFLREVLAVRQNPNLLSEKLHDDQYTPWYKRPYKKRKK